MKLQLHAAWSQRLKLQAEGNKLRAEGNKLRAEGDIAWATAILATLGNVPIKWAGGDCIVGRVTFTARD